MIGTQRDELVSTLVSLTGCDIDLARDILEGCQYNLEAAVNMFYDAQPHTKSEAQKLFGHAPSSVEPVAPPKPDPGRSPIRDGSHGDSKRHTSSSSPKSTPVAPAPSRQKRNYTSFEDLDKNFNKVTKDDKKGNLYAGGASSGIEVKSNAVHITVYRNGILVDGVPPLIPTVGNDAAGVEGREILSAMERKEIHPVLAERIRELHQDAEADELDVEVEKRTDEDFKEASTPSQRVAFQGEVHCIGDDSDTSDKKSGPCRKVPIDLGGAQPDIRMKVSMCGAPPVIINALNTHKLTDVMRHIGFVPKKIIRRSDNTEIERHSWNRSLRHLKLNGQVLLFE